MIKVTQSYYTVESGKAQEAECESIEDICNIPFVQRWLNEPSFSRLCKSTMKDGGHLLVAETNRGKNHWIIAYMDGVIDELPLVEWQVK